MVNVDFEWFNFNAQTDFHGTKTLLRQLLDVDAPLHDVSSLADLILSQPTIGSTVKVGGEETDAYALLTALGLDSHKGHEGLKTLVAYLGEKAGGEVAGALGGKDVGLVLGERLINMPSEVAPPLYAMLLEELDDAVADGEPYAFSRLVVLSRVYREVTPDPEVQTPQQPDRKRVKEASAASSASTEPGEVFYFHAEDEVLRRYACAAASFTYEKEGEAVAESKRAFSEMGIRTEGLVMVLEGEKFREAVEAMKGFLGA